MHLRDKLISQAQRIITLNYPFAISKDFYTKNKQRHTGLNPQIMWAITLKSHIFVQVPEELAKKRTGPGSSL